MTNLPIGNHTVTFRMINGWTTPSNQTVLVTTNSTAIANGIYVGGSLQITIDPAGAINAGGQWQLDGGTNENSGVTVGNLAAGNYTVSFSPIPGWKKPVDQNITITLGRTTMASGVYTESNVPPSTVTLITNGSGTIQHTAWSKEQATGKKYTVTAVPLAKNMFVNWVGGTAQPFSVLSSSASYAFSYEPGLVLEANFSTNVFMGAQGKYAGLFAPGNEERTQNNSGSFSFSVTTTGAFSGSLDLGGQTAPFSGKFGLDGATNVVSKATRGIPALAIALQLDFASQSVNGTVSNSAFTAGLNGFRDVFSSSEKATDFEGQYTMVIPGTDDSSRGPFGTSYGTVKVDALGNVTLAGSLADGTAISQAAVLSQDGYWPLYVNLYGGKGSLWGTNLFTNGILTNASPLSWINETNSSKTAVYRSGFTNQQATLTGGLYLPEESLPSGLAAALQDSNFSITVSNLLENTNKLTFKTNKKTGVISGSFANPANPKQAIKVNGVILQGQTNAQGFFLGTNQSGTFLLGPR